MSEVSAGSETSAAITPPVKLPIVYLRGFAGTTDGINSTTNDPFYGFNTGTTHIRIDGDGEPAYYQFEGPLLRLLMEEGYQLLVRGDQRQLLDSGRGELPAPSVWIDRFYDSAATTFKAQPREGFFHRVEDKLRHVVSADGFNIESAATDLYALITEILARTGHQKVILVAHSMGGLVARCMMQKVCGTPDAAGQPRTPAREIVDKLFTYGTPHGGIVLNVPGANNAMEVFGPAGSDMFSPPKMYGYLTPGKTFGRDEAPAGWDPREMPQDIFDVDNIFCVVGTDPSDYGLARLAVGPQSDGLVQVKNAYIKGAHRAYIYKSHSGPYGEVNSEEGYQNLRRFLFGRWAVALSFANLTKDLPEDGTTWQADMRLAIRGLPIVMSEQTAAHWCPIILNKVAAGAVDPAHDANIHDDQPDAPIPIVSTFLIPPTAADTADPAIVNGALSRYVVTLKVYSVVEAHGAFDFSEHIEQVGDWADSLIIDVGGTAEAAKAWYAWNSAVVGAISSVSQMPNELNLEADARYGHVATVPLPPSALGLPIFNNGAVLQVTVADRHHRTVASEI